MLKHFTYAILLFLCLASCKNNPHDVTRGIYYWKTIYNPTTSETDRLKKLQLSNIYIRLCDVEWNENIQQAVPIAPVHFSKKIDPAFKYVPVIFITQRTLPMLTDKSIALLAMNIGKYVSGVCENTSIHTQEIQIDCDWTAATKDIYFSLLQAIKQQPFFKDKTLSCTIRMHQIKYTARNGIPPADKGLLMCYNMGDMKKPGAHNSILNVTDTKDYTKNISVYPLPLDIALPLFEWSLLFSNNQFKGIMRDVPPDDIIGNPLFSLQKENLYSCIMDTFYKGYSLRKNDIIRLETSETKHIIEVAQYTANRIANKQVGVMLFHCDSLTLSKYSDDELEAIYNTYH